MSISGWFYGPPIERPPQYIEPAPVYSPPVPLKQLPVRKSAALLKQWINPIYLDPKNLKDMADDFDADQSIQLHNFIVEDKFAQLLDAMHEQKWEMRGPVNKRYHERLTDGAETDIVKECKQFLASQPFCDFLKKITQTSLVKATSQGKTTYTHHTFYTLYYIYIYIYIALNIFVFFFFCFGWPSALFPSRHVHDGARPKHGRRGARRCAVLRHQQVTIFTF